MSTWPRWGGRSLLVLCCCLPLLTFRLLSLLVWESKHDTYILEADRVPAPVREWEVLRENALQTILVIQVQVTNLYVFAMKPDVPLSIFIQGHPVTETYVIGSRVLGISNGIRIIVLSIDLENSPGWNIEDPLVVSALFRLAKFGFIEGIAYGASLQHFFNSKL